MLAPAVEIPELFEQSREDVDPGFGGVCLRPVWSTVEHGPISLPPGRYTFGSDESCDFTFSSTGIAEHHCLIVVGRKRAILKANSQLTWLNEGLISEGELSAGDRLVIGPIEFEIEILP